MALTYTPQFSESVRSVITPRLQNIGFQPRHDLVFLRPAGRFTQVIELVAHPPGDERFTVRLGIYVPFAPDANGDPPDPLPVSGVTRCQFRASLGKLLHGRDFIWKTSKEWSETYRQMRDALRGILIHGLCWLSQTREPSMLIRHCARIAGRHPEGHRCDQLPPSVLMGLLYEAHGDAGQARVWYRRAIDIEGGMSMGLRMWVCNRLHNLPLVHPLGA